MSIIDKLEKVTQDIQTGILTRRKVRNTLFRLRSDRLHTDEQRELAKVLSIIYEPQFSIVHEEKMSWDNFTFLWDLHPQHLMMVCPLGQWLNMGGRFDKQNMVCVKNV